MKIKESDLRKIVREAISEIGNTQKLNEGEGMQFASSEFREGAKWMANEVIHHIQESLSSWRSLPKEMPFSVDDIIEAMVDLGKWTKKRSSSF